jgi:hypothetical protein
MKHERKERKEMDRSQIKAVIEATIDSVRQQGALPRSPCTEKLLCAGALFVRSGIALYRSEDEAIGFEQELRATRDKEVILRAAASIGLPVETVQDKIVVNDSLPDDNRVEGVLEDLNKCVIALT